MIEVVKTKRQSVRLESTLQLDSDELESVVSNPQFKERIKNAMKNLHLDHRIEHTQNGDVIAIAMRSFGKEAARISTNEIQKFHEDHIKFLDFLSSLKGEQDPEHEPSEAEILAALSEFLKNTFGAIVIGIVRV
jgi:hypothetical protein